MTLNYSSIRDPIYNVTVPLHSRRAKHILKKYVQVFQRGGDLNFTVKELRLVIENPNNDENAIVVRADFALRL